MNEIEMLKRQLAEKEALIERLNALLRTDPMTGLLNRTGLVEHLNALISMQARTGGATFVAFIDVDDFKRLNTDFGHDGGDHVLTIVAERLKRAVRQHDVVARWSGDEFVIAFHLTKSELESDVQGHIISRLSKLVSEPIIFQEREMHVTCSFGVVRYDQPTHANIEVEDLISAADRAMYTVKFSGKNSSLIVEFQ